MTYFHGIRVVEIGGVATIVPAVDGVAPVITSPLTATTRENSPWSMTLTADENVSFAKRSGADSAAFVLAGAKLSLPAQDYDGGQTAFVCNLVAMDAAGNVANFAVAVTITDVDEIAPLITSPATATVAAATGYAMTLTASEAVTFEKRAGADGDLFGLAGNTLTLPAQAYDAGKPTLTVNLRAVDAAGNATLFTHAVTIAAPGIFTTDTPVISNFRFHIPLVSQSGGAPINMLTGQYAGGGIAQISPPWDQLGVGVVLAAFAGATGYGEIALGNDLRWDGIWIEVNDVKYWLTGDGSTDATSTPGASNILVAPNGGHKTTDRNKIFLPKNTVYRIGWSMNNLSATAKIPSSMFQVPTSMIATASGRGDFVTSGGSRLSAVAGNVAGNVGGLSLNPHIGAPLAVFGWPATPADAAIARAVCFGGMSIDHGASSNESPFGTDGAHMGVYGPIAYGLADPAGGRIPSINLAVPGTQMRDMINNPGTGLPGVAGFAMRDAMLSSLGYPYSTAYFGGPINDMATDTPAVQKTWYAQVVAAWKARGNRWLAVGNYRPQTLPVEDNGTTGGGGANGYEFTGGDVHQLVANAGRMIDMNAFINAKPAGVDAVIDIRAAHESSPGSNKYRQGRVHALTSPILPAPTGVTGSGSGATGILTIEAIGSGTILEGQRVKGPWSNSFFVYIGTQITPLNAGETIGGLGRYNTTGNSNRIESASSSLTFERTPIIYLDTAPDPGDALVIKPGPVQFSSSKVVPMSVSGTGPYRVVLSASPTLDADAGTPVVGRHTNEGTHLVWQSTKAEAAVYVAAKGTAFK